MLGPMGPTATLTVGAAGATLAAVVAMVVVARRARGAGGAVGRRVGLVALVASLVVLAVGSVASYLVVRPGLGSPFFALAHAAYLAAVIGVPALGSVLLVLVATRVLPRRRHLVVIGVVMALLAPLGWYGTHVAPYWLRVERVAVALPSARAGTDRIRIAVLADLQTNHVGSYERRVVTRLMAERPDLILIPGDLFQGDDAQWARTRPAMRALLGRLHAPGGVFAVRGDAEVGDRLDQLVAGTDVRILDDALVRVQVGDRRVALVGNSLRWAAAPGLAARMELLEAPSDEVRIVVAHRPEVAYGFPDEGRVDLVVAGHTHGGQIALPWFGPPVDFSVVPRHVGAGGLHRLAGNPIYVSVGVGMERIQAPQVRLGTRPTIGIVDLG